MINLLLVNFPNIKSILCLHGDLPADEYLNAPNLPLIAADGAAYVLKKRHFSPDIIIGDLDGMNADDFPNSQIIKLPDQNSSDFQKALLYLKENNLLPTLIYGINGGFIDHILNNINIFLQTESIFYAPPIFGFLLKKRSTIKLELPLNTKISLLGLPAATLSSHGLKWELKNARLSFPGDNACFNRTVKPEITLTQDSGTTLVMVYCIPIDDAGMGE